MIKTDGTGLIGPRSKGVTELINEEAVNSQCGALLDVCCKLTFEGTFLQSTLICKGYERFYNMFFVMKITVY